MSDVARKKAVVTGASRGIGRAIAKAFAQAGYEVWALARSTQALETLVSQHEGHIRPLRFDAEKEEDIRAAAATVLGAGAPWVLVNNAGIALSASLQRTDWEDFRRVLQVNAAAPFLLSQALAPAMVSAGGGRIINIASTAALRGYRFSSAYCTSKHALLGLTRALAVELAPTGVTVNAVCPGWTDTDMLAEAAQTISRHTGKEVAEARKLLSHMNPQAKLVQPQDVAALCLFLASPEARGITGAAYPMDGGESA